MICKGTTHNNGVRLARYLTSGKENERAELWELSGFAPGDIREAFRTVHVMAEATRCEQPFFHVQVRLPDDEELSREHWRRVADRIGAKLGLADQPRAIAFHIDERTGNQHMHIAFSRIDGDTMKARPLPFFKERLKEVSRELEKAFNLTRVKSERDGPVQAPTRDEFEQARRLGVDIKQVRQTIRQCWEHSDNGRSFRAALADQNLTLAQGDRRDYVVIDHEGGLHALGGRILGTSAAQTRNRLVDLERGELPTVAQARELISDRQLASRTHKELAMPDAYREELAWQDALTKAAIDKERTDRFFVAREQAGKAAGKEIGERSPFAPPSLKEPPHSQLNRTSPEFWFGDVARENTRDARPLSAPDELKGTPAEIWMAYNGSHNANTFAARLEEHGILLAAATKDEADRSHREAAFAKEIGRFAPVFREREIVAVSESGNVFKLNQRNTGTDRAGIERFMKKCDRPVLGIEATKQVMHERAEAREAYAKLANIVHPIKPRVIDPRPTGRPGRVQATRETTINARAAIGKTTRAAGEVMESLSAAVESLFAPRLTPEQKREGEITRQRRESETEQKIDLTKYTAELAQARQERERDAAVQRQPDQGRER